MCEQFSIRTPVESHQSEQSDMISTERDTHTEIGMRERDTEVRFIHSSHINIMSVSLFEAVPLQ